MLPVLLAFGSVASIYLYVKYRKMKSIKHVNETYDDEVYKKYHKHKPFTRKRRHIKRPEDDFIKYKPYSVTKENPKLNKSANEDANKDK